MTESGAHQVRGVTDEHVKEAPDLQNAAQSFQRTAGKYTEPGHYPMRVLTWVRDLMLAVLPSRHSAARSSVEEQSQ